MADVKWIKITTNIFDDEKILLIESLPDSYAIITVWFKLLCLAGKQNNSGVFMMGRIAYTDKMLATISGGIMIGAGLGIVIRAGASTGGMDIPPLVLNKKLGIPVSVLLYVFDFSILILQMIFSNKEQIIYGILLVLIYTVVLDKVLVMGESKMQVKIVTEKYEEMNRLIQQRLDRGSTLFYAQTGYLRNEQMVVMTVVNGRELAKLNSLVKEVDPEAFMVVGQVHEVTGRGFSIQKKYEKKDM